MLLISTLTLLTNLFAGSTAMTKTQKHACLALGTLIKTFRNNSMHSKKTDTLLTTLQEWLTPYNQSKFNQRTEVLTGVDFINCYLFILHGK